MMNINAPSATSHVPPLAGQLAAFFY